MTGFDLSGQAPGIDGCGITVWAIPLRRLAFAMARMVDPTHLGAELAVACTRMVDAARQAFWVSGTGILARDAYESLQSLIHSRRSSIDSLAKSSGISSPGLALVTFFGGREGARFDPSTLNLGIRNQLSRPRGIVPFSSRFTSQQLNVREQVSAIYLFDELLPVTDDFTFSYQGRVSENWQNKQRLLDRERGRVAARSRGSRPDSGAGSAP
jgi:hypothetical protein